MLFSTVHKLQALSLMFIADPEGSKASLSNLDPGEAPAVRLLASLLLAQKGNDLPESIKSMSPMQFLHDYPMSLDPSFERHETSIGQSTGNGSLLPEETLDSLGISEFRFDDDNDVENYKNLLRKAETGPLLPREQAAILGCFQQLGQMAKVVAELEPVDIASIAQYNPALSAEAISIAYRSHCSTEKEWAEACLLVLGNVMANINTISCWDSLLQSVDIEAEVLASFIFSCIQIVTAMEVSSIIWFQYGGRVVIDNIIYFFIGSHCAQPAC